MSAAFSRYWTKVGLLFDQVGFGASRYSITARAGQNREVGAVLTWRMSMQSVPCRLNGGGAAV